MWKLRISVSDGANVIWVNTPYQTLSEAEQYISRMYPDSQIISQKYEVNDG